MPFPRWTRTKKPHAHWSYYRIPELEPWVETVYEEFEAMEHAVQARSLAYRTLLEQWRTKTHHWAESIQSMRWPRVSLPTIKWPRFRLGLVLPKVTLPKMVLPKRPSMNLDYLGFARAVGRSMKGVTLQLVRVSAASMGLFVIGFLVMNASAYSDILKTSIAEWSGAPVDHSLEEHFVEEEPMEQALIAFTNNPDETREQMASLSLDITPPDNRLIIPRLNKNIPIVESDPSKLLNADWKSLEKTFQEDLQNGVLHYPGTAKPGEVGNAFITGHSSYYLWDPGRYKNVFARLSQVEVGDDLIVYFNQQKYHYQIIEKKEVKNDDVSVLSQTDRSLLTLMTCSPVGTNIRRLVVIAELVNE